MSAKNDGGPAFPPYLMSRTYPELHGMSLRQWYAGMAMNGWLGSYVMEMGDDATQAIAAARVARVAFAIADAMLEFEANEAKEAEKHGPAPDSTS